MSCRRSLFLLFSIFSSYFPLVFPCSVVIPAADVLPAALLGLEALLSPLALPPLSFLPFLPSGAFMGVLAEQSTLSCTGLNMRGSMRGGRSSSWKLPRLSFVCRLALVCSTMLKLKIVECEWSVT